MSDDEKRYSLTQVAEMTFELHVDQADMARLLRLFEGADDNAPMEQIDWGCCDDPRPRIHEQSGRLFCANCRVYLDVPRLSDEREGTAPDEGEDE